MKQRQHLTLMVLMVLSIIVLPLTAIVWAANEPSASATGSQNSVADYDLRQVRWGMTKGEVLRSEPLTPVFESSRSVGYSTAINELNCLLVYLFDHKKLYGAVYYITTIHYSTNIYIEDYRNLKELLNRKYGPALDDAEIWYDDSYKGAPRSYGTALLQRQLEYYAAWESPTTVINLSMAGNGSTTSISGVDLVLGYFNKAFFPAPPRKNKDLLRDL